MFSKISKRIFLIGVLIFSFTFLVILYNYNTWLSTSYPTTNFVKHYYIANSLADFGAENAVTAIYLKYRLFDTLFETMLLFVSVIAVFYFSRHKGEKE